MVWRGNVEERLRGGMVGVENVEEWFKRRNGWRGSIEDGLEWRNGWRGNVEERLRGGIVGVENVEEWFKRRSS